MSKYLVTGGAGYIGGVAVEELISKGNEVVIVDNLSVGLRDNVHPEAVFYEGDMGNANLMNKVFGEHKIEAVLHFAAFAQVGESVTEPAKYFQNNLSQGLNLLDAMRKNGVDKIIFSSTCATYGIPEKSPMDESTPQKPINPYGESKLMMEKVIKWYHQAYGLRYTIFRYFNACGATRQSIERHIPETHLIPIIFEVVMGKRDSITINGTDYPTPDGTCVRDYVHVLDLVDAHIRAIKHMDGSFANEYNLGTGTGYSVKEMISAVEKITNKEVAYHLGTRRIGDPAALVAIAKKAKDELGWEATHSGLPEIISSVWEAIQNPPLKTQRRK